MVIFNEIELAHIKQMIEDVRDFEGFEDNKDNREIVLKEFNLINKNEKINKFLIDEVLGEFYAWYWLRCAIWNMTMDEMCEEMTQDKIFNDVDVSIFRKIYSK